MLMRRTMAGPVRRAARAARSLAARARTEDRSSPSRRGWAVRPFEASPADAGRSYRLAVCAQFKNEADYLAEWIEFHRLVGVEKFFLYDDGSTDASLDVLAPYVAEGVVDLHSLLPEHERWESYNACLATYRDQARWIACLDLDEFLYPTYEDSVADVLEDFERFPAVVVHWLMFSTSGHVLRPAGLVTENFTRCQAEGNRHYKSIVDPHRTTQVIGPHDALYVDGAFPVNERGEEITRFDLLPPTIDRLRINHYWTKSVEEFFAKLARGNSARGRLDPATLIHAERHYNTGEDLTIQRFVPRLKDRFDLIANG